MGATPTYVSANHRPQIRNLENHEPIAPPDVLAEAERIFAEARFKLSCSHAPLESLIAEKLFTGRLVFTTAVPTMAVTMGADGLILLLCNPFDVTYCGVDGTMWSMMHEIGHIKRVHLSDPVVSSNDPLVTLGNETSINYEIEEISGIPVPKFIDGPSSGKPIAIVPKDTYDRYRKDLEGQGLTPKSYDDFCSTDVGCTAELRRMAKQPSPPKLTLCMHGEGDGSGSGSGQPGQSDQGDDQSGKGKPQPGDGTGIGVELSEELIDEVMTGVMQAAIAAAQGDNGQQDLKKELLKLADKTSHSAKASKLWGNYGLGALRGEAVEARQVNWWQRWLRNAMADRIQEGERLVPLHKIGHFFDDTPIRHRGDEYISKGATYIDTSGSMHDQILEYIRRLTGTTENVENEFFNFDTNVVPVSVGQAFAGGGGTSFQCISDHVDAGEEELDFVIVVTDGYAPPITPSNPERWIWLIVDSVGGQPGNDWPADHAVYMDSHRVTIEDLEGGSSF